MKQSTLYAALMLLACSASAVPGTTPRPPRNMQEITSRLVALNDPNVNSNPFSYYLGYKPQDYNTPWGKYYNDTPVSYSPEFVKAQASSPLPASQGIAIQDAGAAMSRPGYLPNENGYTITPNGQMVLAIRTEQPPTFTGEQLDFWFSWHINDTTKYKLWNPAAHQYAAVNRATLANYNKTCSFRERYWNKTSFVDEYIGSTAYQLSIAFLDPRLLGFALEDASVGIETTVAAFVRLFAYTEEQPAQMAANGFSPLDVVLIHQVRKVPGSAQGKKEVRSRFFFGQALVAGLGFVGQAYQMAHDLSVHTATEMGHIGTYLPALFEEFKGDVPYNSS